ncbi:manganese-dependent ADP-ribose/CDP-alcohol diphosphatase [Gastrophryne carolinensis]
MEQSGEAAAAALDSLNHHPPYFTFGVLADIQYADLPDGLSGWKTMRYYRHTLQHLQEAIRQWNRETHRPKFVLQLGDAIDGRNQRCGKSLEALETVLRDMEKAKMPFHHVWGNHELYNFQRDFLGESKLNSSWMRDRRQSQGDEGAADYYAYHFSPHSKFRFILLDTYDLSFYGRKGNSRGYLDSLNFLEQTDKSQLHLIEFNGGVGAKQLQWLEEVLTHCDRHRERAVIAGHIPIHPKAKASLCLAWNYEDILRVVQSHPSAVCYFAGHDHAGGYHRDSHGVHHITMEGVIESPPGQNAYGTVEVYEDKMVLRGRGRVRSRVLPFRMWPGCLLDHCQSLQDAGTHPT